MLYIQQSLGEGEELVQVGHFHWTYTLAAFTNVVWGMVMGLMTLFGCVYAVMHFDMYMLLVKNLPADYSWVEVTRALHPGIKITVFFMFLFGILGYAAMMIRKITTEIAITSTRLVYKTGLIARSVGEISIDRIEGVNVLQSFMGRILGYGRVVVRGMGVGEVILPPIEEPVTFRKSIDRARTLSRERVF